MMWIPGDWMSVTTTATRLPARASWYARLAVRLDFPVPPRYECMETIIGIIFRGTWVLWSLPATN